jgi:hypothetical protein
MATDRNGLDARFEGQVFRKDHPMVLASRRDLASFRPVRLGYNADGYKAGQVLVRDPSDGYFKKYSLASGTGESACVLFEDVNGESSSGTALARGIFGGEVYTSALFDYVAGSKTLMDARDITDASGVQITKF